jgi:uncharacterized damage-inducible protein DinB
MTEREFFIARWAAEMPLTLGVIQALPDAKLDYRPHEKCRTARSIVGHLLGHVEDLNELANATGSIQHRNELPFKNIADALEQMKKSDAVTKSRIPGVDEKTWATKNNKFMVGEHVAFEAPLGATAWILLLDMIHHRGQLSSYIRPMGGKQPDIYGPSGDSSAQH